MNRKRFRPRRFFPLIFGMLLPLAQAFVAHPADPLESPQWDLMHKTFLGGEPVVFDERVRLLAPATAENAMAVPVWLDAQDVGPVDRIVVVADLNPLPKVLEFKPGEAAPRLGFKVKIQQATPVRVAARTRDGVWHVGGRWIDAAGGGCTAPSVASGNRDWADRLGEIHARLWRKDSGGRRLKFSLMHPMDTGLAAGIPAFYAETVQVLGENDNLIAEILPLEPVAENPLFTLDLPRQSAVRLVGRDNNGNVFKSGRIQ